MKKSLFNLLQCPKCNSGELKNNDSHFDCMECLSSFTVEGNIPRFVSGEYHSNFGYQWNQFSKVQLDSYNKTNLSESRRLNQSGANPLDFKDLNVLEIGAGNGRFTEILLKYGANVVAVDYSTAIDANYENNSLDNNRVIFIQADLFNLPVKIDSFDVVICYGVIQHTGDNEKALLELCRYPKKGGKLFIDIYSNGLRHFNPWVYMIRPFFSLIKTSDEKRLEIVSKFVDFVFPFQIFVLRFLHNKKGFLKIFRYMVNRSPNSVYGINLFLDGKINCELAKEWSVMDTFDGWAPKHDHPISKRAWLNMINNAAKNKGFYIINIDQSGQGHTASLTRN